MHNLETLSLIDNKISQVSLSIGKLKHLKVLHFWMNEIHLNSSEHKSIQSLLPKTSIIYMPRYLSTVR